MRNVLVAALFAAACSGGTVVQSSACNQTVTGSSLNGTAYAPLGCEEVFGNIDKFKLWIKAPSLIFNGEAPVSVLDTSAGFDMVFRELGRIEHGIFA